MALNSVSEDVVKLLEDNSKGISGTDLFPFEWGSGSGGTEINKQILVVDTGNITSTIKELYEQATFVIFVRGSTNEGAKSVHDRARDIYEFMITQERIEINEVVYFEFSPGVDNILPLGKDDNDRFLYSMNLFTYRDSVQ